MNNLYKEIPAGENSPEEINVVVEIPEGNKNKYEYKEEGFLGLDRTLFSPMFFPFSYGFIPQTLSEDGDSLDVILLLTYPVVPQCVVKARPIGVLFMADEKGTDDKIVAVPLEEVDPRFKEIRSVEDLGEHKRKEIETFFSDYKKLEKGKHVEIKGWGKREDALRIIKESIERFHKDNQ